MIKNYIYYLLPFLLLNCSVNSKSEFWNKQNKKNQTSKSEVILFEKNEKSLTEINQNIEVSLNDNYKLKTHVKNLSNNNKITNYSGLFKKNNIFKYSKIKNYELLNPDLLITSKNEIIYFDGNGQIFKLDKNLKVLWKLNIYEKGEKKIGPKINFAENKGILVAFDNIANFFSLRMSDGKLLWKKKHSSSFNSQVKIYKNKIYVIDLEDTLKCYSLKDGEELWSYKSETNFIKSTNKTSLIIADDKVIFINSLGDLNALDINNGNLIWQTPTQNNPIYEDAFSIIYSDIINDRNNVYFSNNKNEMFSIKIKNGAVNWVNRISSTLKPTAIDKLIFTISSNGFLVIINKINGKIIRATNFADELKIFNNKKKPKINGFIIAKNYILISIKGSIFKLNIRNGKIENSIKINSKFISRPYISNKEMIVVSNNNIKSYK